MPKIELTSLNLETLDGHTLALRVFSDGDDAENGLLRIAVTGEGVDSLIDLSPAHYSEAWLQRLARTLEMDAEFRTKSFPCPPPTDDEGLEDQFEDAQRALARENVAIRFASLGEEDPFFCRHPSIFLAEGHFPLELQRAWWNAGFRSLPGQIQAKAPIGHAATAARALVLSLRDWQAGELDLSGERYKLNINLKDTRPKLPSVSHTRPIHEIQAEIVRLNQLGEEAKFKDFLKLKSGRDEWTRKKLPDLQASMQRYYPGLKAPASFEGDLSLEASWSRWILRGLKPKLAERKILADLEVQKNARPESTDEAGLDEEASARDIAHAAAPRMSA